MAASSTLMMSPRARIVVLEIDVPAPVNSTNANPPAPPNGIGTDLGIPSLKLIVKLAGKLHADPKYAPNACTGVANVNAALPPKVARNRCRPPPSS